MHSPTAREIAQSSTTVTGALEWRRRVGPNPCLPTEGGRTKTLASWLLMLKLRE